MKTKCQDLSIDLMHFSTDEFKEVKDIAGLKAHLKRCPDCRKHLKGLREVHLLSVLSRPRSAKYQQKMAELLRRVKAESRQIPTKRQWSPGLIGINAKQAIEQAAVKIHDCLKEENGKVPIRVIRKKTGLVGYPFYEALGSLATQEKAILNKTETTYSAEAR